MNPLGKITAAQERIAKAEAHMEHLLAEAFPIGCEVRCWLMHGQENPSCGVVIGHTGGRYAYLRIRLGSRTRAVRDVPVNRVWRMAIPTTKKARSA